MPEITRLEPEKKKGLVVVITGHGKGKTTTALGIAVRACGHNMSVSMIQFMKGDIYAGEWDGINKLNGSVELIATGIPTRMKNTEKTHKMPYVWLIKRWRQTRQISSSWTKSTMRCI